LDGYIKLHNSDLIYLKTLKSFAKNFAKNFIIILKHVEREIFCVFKTSKVKINLCFNLILKINLNKKSELN